MRLLRRIAGLLGFAKEEAHEVKDQEEIAEADLNAVDPNLPRKGFSVPVKVAVPKAQVGPVLLPCGVGDGGVQGLKWYARRLKVDEDGDVADEFLNETSSPSPSSVDADDHHPQHRAFPRFEIKYSAKPAKVRNQALAPDGRIQHKVECQGRLQWVV